MVDKWSSGGEAGGGGLGGGGGRLGGKTGVLGFLYFFVFKNWARVWAWVDWVLGLVLVIIIRVRLFKLSQGPFV